MNFFLPYPAVSRGIFISKILFLRIFLRIKSIFKKIQMGRTVYLAFYLLLVHGKVLFETKIYRNMMF